MPAPGLRVDVIGFGARCEVWIIECKSSCADFASDRKWEGYLPWCDRFFWAVDADFPEAILPPASGLIRADAYEAAIIRLPEPAPLAPARRRALLERFARTAAERLVQFEDPTRRFDPPR